MMRTMNGRDVYFITHTNVAIEPDVPVPEWSLSPRGRDRMRAFAASPLAQSFASVFSSTEQKAVESVAILVDGRAVGSRALRELGENDRSSTGYMPKEAFEATADRFFAEPDTSVRGWETARAAQARIVTAVHRLLADAPASPIAIVAHGGVGTLLLCHLLGEPISRARDQPGSDGGNYFHFEARGFAVVHGWQSIEP